MIIDCISDLHGFYPKLEGGDLLIVAGDLTARDLPFEFLKFLQWLDKQKYRKKIFIGGNHDNMIQKMGCPANTLPADTEYLCDSGTEFEGLKIYGSPWTRTFEGMNPHCKAFTVDTEEELAKKWALIPKDTDILITHSPPFGILDLVPYNSDYVKGSEHVGSTSLKEYVINKVNPKLWVWGHIHEAYGEGEIILNYPNTIIAVNASHVNERYQPVNKQIRVIL